MNVAVKEDIFTTIEMFHYDEFELPNFNKVCDLVNNSRTVIELCHSIYDMCDEHYMYEKLAVRIYTQSIHRKLDGFTNSMKRAKKMLNDKLFSVILEFGDQYDEMIKPRRDYDLSFLGWLSLSNYLICDKTGEFLESPQYMFMRTAIQLWDVNLDKVRETYDLTSQRYFTHATPTLFNSCLKNPQLASCYLLSLKDDSIEGIFNTHTAIALISKGGGGIGLSATKLRGSNSVIETSQRNCKGIVPVLKGLENIATYVDQGSKRPGSIAVYIEPWHSDIVKFLDSKMPSAQEQIHDLFLALWIPDLFMKRVESGQPLSLFNQPESDILLNLYGEKFESMYEKFEHENKAVGIVDSRELYNKMLLSAPQTGGPFILFKDTINKFSNQQNLGTHKSSNLCCEIMEYTDENEIAVCNLANINLPMFIKNKSFDFNKLAEVVQIITRNLDRSIDCTYYPLKEAKYSNKRNRPIGIGIQGYQDLLFELDIDYTSSQDLNVRITETIDYYSLKESIRLAKELGPYKTFNGSPLSRGHFHWQNYKVTPTLDYDSLRIDLMMYGCRNSLRVAYMPTASTAHILGSNECFDPQHSNYYLKQLLKTTCKVVNKYLQKELLAKGLWTSELRDNIIRNGGSIKHTLLTDQQKKKYKTVWEIDPKFLVDMAVARQPFIDQGQSMSLYMESPDINTLGHLWHYGWKSGLKTGMYYLRTKPPLETTLIYRTPDCLTCS